MNASMSTSVTASQSQFDAQVPHRRLCSVRHKETDRSPFVRLLLSNRQTRRETEPKIEAIIGVA